MSGRETPDDELREGDWLPDTYRLWPDERLGPWCVLLLWQMRAGRAECVGMNLRSADHPDDASKFLRRKRGQPLTASMIRELPVGRFIAEDREALYEVTGDALYDASAGRASDAGSERLIRVAQTYRQAQAEGKPTAKAVSVVEDVSESYARKLIWDARRRSLLMPASSGVAPVKPGKRVRKP